MPLPISCVPPVTMTTKSLTILGKSRDEEGIMWDRKSYNINIEANLAFIVKLMLTL